MVISPWRSSRSIASCDAPRAKLRRDLAFDRIALASVLGQLDEAEPVGKAGEEPARVDLGKLAWIADQDDLRAVRRRLCDERGETARAEHPGLVDDEHGRGVEAFAP